MPLYNAFIRAEANPETAATGARCTRDETRKALEPAWRKFINGTLSYPDSIVLFIPAYSFGVTP
jgi:hypothetical protein